MGHHAPHSSQYKPVPLDASPFYSSPCSRLAKGLYKGLIPANLREVVYSSLRFGLYVPIKQLLGETDPAPRGGCGQWRVASRVSLSRWCVCLGGMVVSTADDLPVRLRWVTGCTSIVSGVSRQISVCVIFVG